MEDLTRPPPTAQELAALPRERLIKFVERCARRTSLFLASRFLGEASADEWRFDLFELINRAWSSSGSRAALDDQRLGDQLERAYANASSGEDLVTCSLIQAGQALHELRTIRTNREQAWKLNSFFHGVFSLVHPGPSVMDEEARVVAGAMWHDFDGLVGTPSTLSWHPEALWPLGEPDWLRRVSRGALAQIDLMLPMHPTNPGASELEIYVDPGAATAAQLKELFGAISDLHVAAGGLGLEFRLDGQFLHAREGVQA